jgi:hypothetical protein
MTNKTPTTNDLLLEQYAGRQPLHEDEAERKQSRKQTYARYELLWQNRRTGKGDQWPKPK